MAAKKKAEGVDTIRALIAAHPTWSDAQIHGELKGGGATATREEVAEVRRTMGDKHTWKESR